MKKTNIVLSIKESEKGEILEKTYPLLKINSKIMPSGPSTCISGSYPSAVTYHTISPTHSYPISHSTPDFISTKDFEVFIKKIEKTGLKCEFFIYKQLSEEFEKCKDYSDLDKIVQKIHKKFAELDKIFG